MCLVNKKKSYKVSKSHEPCGDIARIKGRCRIEEQDERVGDVQGHDI